MAQCTPESAFDFFFLFPTHPTLLQEFSHADPPIEDGFGSTGSVRFGSLPKIPETEESQRHECHGWELHNK